MNMQNLMAKPKKFKKIFKKRDGEPVTEEASQLEEEN